MVENLKNGMTVYFYSQSRAFRGKKWKNGLWKNMRHFIWQRGTTMIANVMSGNMNATDGIILENFGILFELLKGGIGSGIIIFNV